MRNLLISLTFIFALIIGNSTNVFSQGGTLPTLNSTVSLTITISENDGTFEGTGIVTPITGRVGIESEIRNLEVDIEIKQGKKTLYSNSSQYSSGWELHIPINESNTWGSGDFTITATVGGVSIISDVFTLD